MLAEHPGRREERHQGQDRRDREVLEQQDGEGALAVGGLEVAALLEHLQRDRGRRQRQHDPDDDGASQHKPARDRGGRKDRDRHAELRRAEPEDVAAHRDQPRQLELEPDDEEQEHDAELGDAADGLGLADERQAGRADDDAGGEVAEDAGEAEAPEQRHGDHRRGAEDQHRRQEARMRDRIWHACAIPAAPGRCKPALTHHLPGGRGWAGPRRRLSTSHAITRAMPMTRA